MKKLILMFFVFIIAERSFGQPPITYSININTLPTCSTCCDGGICVTVPSGGCNGPYTAEWSTGNTGPASCSPGMYCYNTTYTICVYDICDTTCKTFTMPAYTGIKEFKIQTEIKVFPNPVSNTLFISSEQNEFDNSNIEITNLFGQSILKFSYSNEIDVSSLSYGYYILKITTPNNKQLHSKFIKECLK